MKFKHSIFIIALFLVMQSCHKSDALISTASVNITNAIPEGKTLIPVFGNDQVKYYSSAQKLNYGAVQFYSILSGLKQFSVVDFSDTSHIVFSGNLNLKPGGLYSFFITNSLAKPDTLFVEDHIVVYPDSSAGVRFVNLTIDRNAISVNIKGNYPSKNEFENIGYKQITQFKKYLANYSIPNKYTFEFRDQNTGKLLTSFDWRYKRYQNNTIIIVGTTTPGTGIPIKIIQANNY